MHNYVVVVRSFSGRIRVICGPFDSLMSEDLKGLLEEMGISYVVNEIKEGKSFKLNEDGTVATIFMVEPKYNSHNRSYAE